MNEPDPEGEELKRSELTYSGTLIATLFLRMGIVLAVIGIPLALVTPVLLIIGLGWIAVALGLRVLFRTMHRRRERLEALRHEGAPGVATILDAKRTKTKYGPGSNSAGLGRRVWQMRLQIEAEGMKPYEIEKRILPEVGPSGRQVGQKWPVFVDREDPSNFLVDWEAFQASGHSVEISPGLVISSQEPRD